MVNTLQTEEPGFADLTAHLQADVVDLLTRHKRTATLGRHSGTARHPHRIAP
ncbi:hypothetical protein ACQP1O_20625 [Nocardia sp. CA-151230]|uniref:hypothetical protein n=1 Tax=Nocardia sp. CA-151230 TaxID=3239982 RepID=UPI003D917C75